MRTIAKVIVGSRLHRTNRPDSDTDYRGIFLPSLRDTLSPFKKQKTTSWVEGVEDNTSYELAEFIRLATHGNATILEVLFSDMVVETSLIHQELVENWEKVMDTEAFFRASRGYAHNQYNKFYNFDDVGILGQARTTKFAIAFLRVMWQCEQFLLTGKFIPSLENSSIYPLVTKIKGMHADELPIAEVYTAMDKINRDVCQAYAESKFKHMKPDFVWLEDFIERSYCEK